MAEDKWWLNCSMDNIGYYVVLPWVSGAIKYFQRVIFDGKKYPVSDIVLLYDGIDAKGAYFKENEMKEFISEIIKVVLNNPAKAEKIIDATFKINSAYFDFSEYSIDIDYSNVSNKELHYIFAQQIEMQTKGHMHSLSLSWFLDSQDSDFSRMLIERTNKICEERSKSTDYAEAFSLLTTLPKNSIELNEEIESLELLNEIKKDKKAAKALKSIKNFSKIPRSMPAHIKQKIIGHYDKWNWVPFTYLGPAYSIDHYLKHWNSLLKLNTAKALKELKERPGQVEKERNALIKKLKISDEEKRIYDIAARVVFLKGYRKACLFKGMYALSFILKEIAKRLGLSMNQAHMLTYEEVDDYLVNGVEPDVDEINKRQGKTVLHYTNEELKIHTGKDAENFLESNEFKKEEVDLNASELMGVCACSGKAKGIVKVVNKVEDMHKMEKGNIMVSHATFPSLVPAMKKASAILTEEGGITCHAAIVSREMNTPCITGIKNAITIMKDGDFVEVDAGRAVVEIKRDKKYSKNDMLKDFGTKEELEKARYDKHQRDYDILVIDAFMKCYKDKGYINYYGKGYRPLYVFIKDEILYHLISLQDSVDKIKHFQKRFSKKQQLKEIEKSKLLIKDFREFIKKPMGDPFKAVEVIHDWLIKLIPFAFVLYDSSVAEESDFDDKEVYDLVMGIRNTNDDLLRRVVDYQYEALRKIEKNNSLEEGILGYITLEELETFKKNRELPLDVEKRKEFVFAKFDGESVKLYDDEDLLYDSGLVEKVDENIKEFKGITACEGKIKGKAFIIRKIKEADQLQEGDILFASMTDPRYLPAMKKAGAIVTDEGGVTCHAAIVSRELGIPCVVGTKVATSVVKSGDIVEVDADNGDVRVVERK